MFSPVFYLSFITYDPLCTDYSSLPLSLCSFNVYFLSTLTPFHTT
nr:MAG TPA: hypothetical protein [Bacteriophage sp.]